MCDPASALDFDRAFRAQAAFKAPPPSYLHAPGKLAGAQMPKVARIPGGPAPSAMELSVGEEALLAELLGA